MKVSLGKLSEWVKDQVTHGDYETDSDVIREAVRRMKNTQPSEPKALQLLMDQAENSGFEKMRRNDWTHLRRLARAG
jgi:putative addiction module CopG family antidote